MEICSSELKIGEVATIASVNLDEIPLKLLEMGCLPGNSITLIQIAPLGDPLYFNVNDSHVAIRIATAKEIRVTKN
jgi:ferrous iron transport protein A